MILGGLWYIPPLKHPARPYRLHQRVEPTIKPAGDHNGLTPLDSVDAFANNFLCTVPKPAWRGLFDVVHTRCGVEVSVGEADAERADVYSMPLYGKRQRFRQSDDVAQ